MTTISAPTPTRPWRPSTKDKLRDLIFFLLSIVVTYVIVAITPMKGKLAYFILFFLLYMSLTAGMQYFKRGSAAAIDAFVSSLVAVGESITLNFFVTNLYGTTYYPTAFKIDGVTITPQFQGGSSIVSANPTDLYVLYIARSLQDWRMYVSQTKFG